MAVVSCKLIEGLGGSYESGSESTSLKWQIVVDSLADTHSSIAFALVGNGLPVEAAPHPDNVFLRCERLRIDQHRGFIWIATAEYSTRPFTQEQLERSEYPNPIDRSVKISWNTVSYSKAVVKDIHEKAIVNTAGDPYDPPPEVPWERLTFNFRKNFETPPLWLLNFLNSVNDSDISILGITVLAGNAKFSQPAGEDPLEENGYLYYPVSWSIECDLQTWQLELLNEGLRYRDASSRVNITDDNGDAVSAPYPLDENGAKLANPTPDNVIVNTYEVFSEQDYTELPGVQSA